MAISGMGGYNGTSNGMQLMRNESTSDSLAAILGPGLQGARHLEDAVAMQAGTVGHKRAFFAAAYDGPTVEDGPVDDADDGGDDLSPGASHLEKKRRLTFDQVRSLEKNFEMENKLEPERKMQLAKELGLRPRQVAVWFQNRRARWKTKQLERDYETLAADYERLKADLEQVVDEKNRLISEVQRLSGASTTTTTIPAAPESRHQNSRLSPTVDVSVSGCTDASNSSDVLDADSPRTTDSSSPSTRHSEHVELGPPESSAFMAPEDGIDQSCSYLLLQLDEQSVLPWWDWP